MAHQGESGGNMARPSNPSGHFTPSFPTPATIAAQASHQALFHENQCDPSIGARTLQLQLGHPSADTLVPPPAVAPQTFHLQPESQPRPRGTMPQAGVPIAMPLQRFSGTAAVQPLLHGKKLAAYAHGWSQPLPPPPQAPPAPRYAGLQRVEPSDSGNPLPPPPQDARTLQRSMVAMAPNGNSAAPPVGTNSYGATSQAGRPMLPPSGWPGSCWAPPVQQPGGGGQTSWAPQPQQPSGQTSWAWAPPAQQRPGMPAASPASGSAQAQPPRVTTGKKTFEEFLLEAGVLDQSTVDRIFLDDLVEEMLGDEDDGQAELGPVERDGRMVSLGDVLLALGLGAGSSSSSGASTHQVRMPAQDHQAHGGGAGATGGCGCGCDQAAAAEARERRSRRMAKRKEAAARHHRPEKHAAPPRGSQN